MTDREKREMIQWLRMKSVELETESPSTARLMNDAANELSDQIKQYYAKWPEHRGCLISRPTLTGEPNTAFMTAPVHEGELLYTGVHKLNMIPHNGSSQCPIDGGKTVFVRYHNGILDAGSGVKFTWSNVKDYCPVDPVRVEV